MKKFIAGFLSCALLLIGTTVFAENINVILGQVKIVVNGKSVNNETLLYNGTTYVPLRTVAEALGKDVTYDSGTKTAYINDRKVSAANPNAANPNEELKYEHDIATDKLDPDIVKGAEQAAIRDFLNQAEKPKFEISFGVGDNEDTSEVMDRIKYIEKNGLTSLSDEEWKKIKANMN